MAQRLLPLALLPLISGGWCALSCDQTVVIADQLAGLGGAEAGAGGSSEGQAGAPGQEPSRRPVFAEPQLITTLSDPDAKDQDPTLTGDLLEIYFFSDRAGEPDLWSSKRASPDAPWQAPLQVIELSSPELDINPAISRDGLRLWFHSQREPAGIWFTERNSRAEPWGPPVHADAFGGEIAPGPSADELRMAVSVSTDDNGREIYESTRASLSDAWSVPQAIKGINGPSDDSTPFLVGDGTEIFFSSARTGQGDLYWTSRPSLADAAFAPEPLDELNLADAFESHPHVTPDGSTIFFGSSRSGNTDLYEAVLRP